MPEKRPAHGTGFPQGDTKTWGAGTAWTPGDYEE